jgi:membrane-associated protease RseP (regulator of RpoE activity)
MNFIILDLILLGLFLIFVVTFLYRRRKKIQREGLLFLYRTSWGIKLIEKTGKKYKKTLKILSHVSVWLGYVLMVIMIYLFGRILYIYVFHADVVRAIKIPPVMPLIPYLPQMFQLNFLPPFYFSYWIIVLAIIAITHEFFHGIFAQIAKVKTKTTGFGFFPFFLPIFLAAFVELDEKNMVKKSNFKQRAVLSAGTFANTLTAILGMILMFGFFSISFSPAGVVYDDYAYNVINISSIKTINDLPLNNFSELGNLETNKIKVNGENYYALKQIDLEKGLVALYYDSPAINQNLTGAIISINNEKITNLKKLSEVMDEYSPQETILLETFDGQEKKQQNITLEESPEGNAWLGITFLEQKPKGVLATISAWATSYKKPHIYYEPDWEFAKYIYDLLWWLVLISFSVALVNMLPMGIFDGGRFFYLTILAITKSEKKAEKAFKGITKFFLFLLFVVMFFWLKSFF